MATTTLYFKLGETGPYEWLGLDVKSKEQAWASTTPAESAKGAPASAAQVAKIKKLLAHNLPFRVELKGGQVRVLAKRPAAREAWHEEWRYHPDYGFGNQHHSAAEIHRWNCDPQFRRETWKAFRAAWKAKQQAA
jgi:hypothetical protein